MSLGAIDFGIVVDGSIVIVEGILAHLYNNKLKGRTLSGTEMDEEVEKGASGVVRSATFAVFIILIVFFPILTLSGIEGKYFTRWQRHWYSALSAHCFSPLTYVPMMASLFKTHHYGKTYICGPFLRKLNVIYQRCLHFCLRFKWQTVTVAFATLIGSFLLFGRLGAEFIPTLTKGTLPCK